MSKLASAADYKREIEEVRALIRKEEETSERLGSDFASETTIASLRKRLATLQEELSRLSDEELPGHTLSLVFGGDPVHGEKIDVTFLGKVLQRFQALVHAMVNAQFGNLSQHGSWPEEVLRRSTLEVAETFPGSFGVVLETLDEQLELEQRLAIQPALEDLFSVISSEKEGAAFLQELGPMGPRARSHLRTLLYEFSQENARVDLQWPLVEGELRASISPRRAKELATVLKRIEESDRLEKMEGLLEGAIIRKRFFELQLQDGTIIAGHVSADLQQAVTDYFGQWVKAQVLVTTVRDKGTGVEKDTYRLMTLEPAEPPEDRYLTD